MTVSLPPDLNQFVQQELASGKYPSESALVVAAVRLLHEREARLLELRREITPALERLDRGEGIELYEDSLDAFFEEVKRGGRENLQSQQGGR